MAGFMRRKDRELNFNEALKIIDECEYATISTIDNGEIFSVPISIARDGLSVFIHGAKGGSKARLLKDGCVLSMVCVSSNLVPKYSDDDLSKFKPSELGAKVFTTEYKSAIAKVEAFSVTDEGRKIHALRLLCEKYTSESMDYFQTAIEHSLKITSVYELVIKSVSAKAKILK